MQFLHILYVVNFAVLYKRVKIYLAGVTGDEIIFLSNKLAVGQNFRRVHYSQSQITLVVRWVIKKSREIRLHKVKNPASDKTFHHQ